MTVTTKNKKPFKRITADNLYRPKTFTVRNCNRFFRQLIDLMNWGFIDLKDGKKFRFKLETLQNAFHKSTYKLKELPSAYDILHHRHNTSILEHLHARENPTKFAFYTSNKFSDIAMLCGDIDTVDGYGFAECLEALRYLRTHYFINTYWEPSTGGNGIHFYILVDFSTFPGYPNEFDLLHRESCNAQIELLSTVVSDLIGSMFFCKFCAFRGTYPVYSFPLKNNIILNRGSLVKLPCPQTESDFSLLVNTPILSFSDLGNIYNRMVSLLNETPKELIPNHTKDPIHRSDTIVSGLTLPLEESPSEPSSPNPPYTYNILGSHLPRKDKNSQYLDDNDTFKRYRNSIQKLSRELGRVPSYEEWDMAYPDKEREGKHREKEFEVISKYVDQTFDPDIIEPVYCYGDYLEALHRDLTQDQINKIVREKTTYTRKVTLQDLDIGLGAHWMAVRTNMGAGKELCVPRNTIPGLFRGLKDKGIVNRSCNLSKALAIRVVLEQLGYIRLIDDFYSWSKEDRISQKWGMGAKFPKFKDYQIFCGSAEREAIRIKESRIKQNIENEIRLEAISTTAV